MKFKILWIAGLMLAAMAGQVQAGIIAATSDAATGTSLINGPFTLGWSFTVNQNITLDALGVYDSDQDGLGQSHDVGVFDAGGTLLAATTVASGTSGTLIDKYRFQSIAGLTLTTGNTYSIGAVWLDGTDGMLFDNGGISFSPDVNYVDSNFAAGSTLQNPAFNGGGGGYYGPNFTYTTAAVPEPSSIAMLGIGAIGLFARRKRQQMKLAA